MGLFIMRSSNIQESRVFRRFLRVVAAAAMMMVAILGTISRSPGQIQRESGFEPHAFAITRARIVVSPDEEIEQGTIVIRDGLIAAVGKDVAAPADAEIIDGTGLIVYPGFIDAASSSLLDPAKNPTPSPGRPIDYSRFALAATPPDNRKAITPEFEALRGLKSDGALVEARRKLGFTTVHVVPTGRIASGQGLLQTTSGAPLRESVLVQPTFAEFQLLAPGSGGYPATLMGATAHLRQAFLDARRHMQHHRLYEQQVPSVGRPPEDPVLHALGEIAERQHPSIFVAQSRDDIHRTLDFGQEHQLPVILWGGHEAYRAVDRVKQQARGIIVQVDWGDEPKIETDKPSEGLTADAKPPVRVQEYRRDEWRRRVGGLKILHDHQIPFALSGEGLKEPGDLFKSLRQAIQQGLPQQAVLAGMTRNAAAVLGQENRLGTLAVGKLAHIAVWNGPFHDERSKVRYLFVDGMKFEYNKTAAPVPAGEQTGSSGPTLAGTWQVEIESADGKVAATLEIAQKGSALSGTFKSSQGEGRIASGKLDGDKFEFVVAIGVGAQNIELKFSGGTGELQDGKLAGTLKSAFGAPTKFAAARQAPPKPAESSNPVTLAVDDSGADKEKAGSASRGDAALPTELESDRLQRHIKTGGNVLIRNGTVWTGFGDPQPETSVLVRQGKIAAIGRDLEPDADMQVIDASGRFVIPGIIDTHSHIMFAAGMGGVNEFTASIVPEVRVKDVVRTDDPAEYRALAGGTTAARLLHGSANTIGGQDAVVKFKYGELARRQILQGNPQGVKFALGENVKRQADRFPNTRLGVEATLNRAFLEAVDYRRQWMEYNRRVSQQGSDDAPPLLPPRRDLRLEALADIVDHQKFIHSHCYRADEILMLLRVTSNLGIRVWSLQHVLEGYKIAAEITAHGASCSTFSDWWAYKVEAYDATPYNAALLAEAGANVVLKSDDAELIRHLYLEAAKTVRYGNVAPDAALRMVTLNAARELGLDGRMGSIEVGKDADLGIFSGHPLSAFSRCEMSLIEGEVYFVREKQPSAMSEKAALASAHPRPLVLPPREIREKRLDLTRSPEGRYAIVGGTIHPVEGPDIEQGTLLIDAGTISAIGSSIEVPVGTRIVDASGLHVYPGLIDTGTVLGLTEIGAVRETHDYQESGRFQPDLRAGVAINPDSELIPVTRSGGITASLVRPVGGIIAGQASLIKLDGWTVPEMVLDYEAGLQINWPGGNDNTARVDQLRDFLVEARLYHKVKKAANEAQTTPPVPDPRYESLGPYLRGEKRIFVEANSRKEIVEALQFAEKEDLKIVITGAEEAWKIASELKKRDTPVVIGAVMARPFTEYDPFDAQYANPGRLHEAGVLFAVRSVGSTTAGFSASNSRNAPFEAGMAVAYGLPEEEALKAVTLNAARILQVDDRLGSLAPGKMANVIICDGSPLQQTTEYKGIFVAGKPYAPESRHTRLYEKYRGRLHEIQAQRQQDAKQVAPPERSQ
jgi:imidazolonepropionase-like amidohydrolase